MSQLSIDDDADADNQKNSEGSEPASPSLFTQPEQPPLPPKPGTPKDNVLDLPPKGNVLDRPPRRLPALPPKMVTASDHSNNTVKDGILPDLPPRPPPTIPPRTAKNAKVLQQTSSWIGDVEDQSPVQQVDRNHSPSIDIGLHVGSHRKTIQVNDGLARQFSDIGRDLENGGDHHQSPIPLPPSSTPSPNTSPLQQACFDEQLSVLSKNDKELPPSPKAATAQVQLATGDYPPYDKLTPIATGDFPAYDRLTPITVLPSEAAPPVPPRSTVDDARPSLPPKPLKSHSVPPIPPKGAH